MNPEHARTVLLEATWEDYGTFTLLRLGQDPGSRRIHELRLALRVLWKHWKEREALPFDIVGAAATILHFRDESASNFHRSGQPIRETLLDVELPDLVQGAFELLSGPEAEGWTVLRQDLGEKP